VWLADYPNNLPALRRYARRLLAERKYPEALAAAKRVIELCPEDLGPESAYAIAAVSHRELGDADGERKALETLAVKDGDVTDAHLRLMEMGEETQDWHLVATSARRLLAVNPLIVAPHRSLARSAEELGRRDDAIRSYRALLEFDTTDPAHTHFRLATLLREAGQLEEAKRQVLMALDEAPRYREAHQLLLALTAGGNMETATDSKAAPTDSPPATGSVVPRR
jgi:tetratricopeptide (TPR) repeat protein